MRIIMHIDMDHFFAAIEERENPQLKGKPVIVGSDPKEGFGRGVVSTANYIARRSGIKSGMPISRAWKLCPDGIFIPVNGELYWHVSDNIMQILRQYSDRFGQTGIDEASLDLTNKVKAYDEAEILAGDIKKEILEKEGLTCSIGIGPNKLVAKIASNYKKPNGITIVDESKIKSFLEPLPIRDLWGVGKKTEPILLEMGIKTIGDLSKYPINLLIQRFGMWGYEFHKLANGIDNNEVVENWEAKSIGRETTFEEDTSDPYFVLREVYELCKEVYEEVLQNNYLFKRKKSLPLPSF